MKKRGVLSTQNMVRHLNVLAACILFAAALYACRPRPAFALDPQSATVTNLRYTADSYVAEYEFYQGEPILLTNCVIYSGGSTSSAVQDLSGVGLTLKVGMTSSNHTYDANVQVASNGTWWALFTVPTNWPKPYLQLSLTNAVTTNTYPRMILKTREAL